MLAFIPSGYEWIWIFIIFLLPLCVGLVFIWLVAKIIARACNQKDRISQLEKLSLLLEKGYLTREEFETQKKKLLS